MTATLLHHMVVGPLACNCYVVGDPLTKDAIVIDPGGDAEVLQRTLDQDGLNVTAIIATHAHFDHVLAAEALRAATGAPFYLHSADGDLLGWMEESGRLFLGAEIGPPPEIDGWAQEGDRLVAGSAELEVLHTPGHSPGSISLISTTALFSGDSLFKGSIGRTDLPGGDTDTLLSVIRNKLFALDEGLPVYPGHGPATTLEEERRFNPFVGSSGGLWTPPA
jgi:hydroxyacylglutathione hydrolase